MPIKNEKCTYVLTSILSLSYEIVKNQVLHLPDLYMSIAKALNGCVVLTFHVFGAHYVHYTTT